MGEIKKKVLWGAGGVCRNYFKLYGKEDIAFIIDNDKEKNNKEIDGVIIKHPSEINNWNELFIIIACIDYKSIEEQLIGYGMKKKVDFISYCEYVEKDIVSFNEINNIKDEISSKFQTDMFSIKVHNRQEFNKIYDERFIYYKYELALSNYMKKSKDKFIYFPAKCNVCNKETKMYVDFTFSDGVMPAWRESIICPSCMCNNRMRLIIGKVKSEYKQGMKVYAYERITNTYKELNKFIPDIIGSEYFGSEYKSGEILNNIKCNDGSIINNALHEDAQNLSFEDESFDLMISCDVFEHVADYKKAFKEAARCLKKGGKLIMTVPINYSSDTTQIRAKIVDGKLVNIMKPSYHGNPLSEKGSLVFQIFGWDILGSLKEAGFSDSYAVAYYSIDNGNLGYLSVYFEAIK